MHTILILRMSDRIGGRMSDRIGGRMSDRIGGRMSDRIGGRITVGALVGVCDNQVPRGRLLVWA